MGKGQDGHDLSVLSQSLRERDAVQCTAMGGGWGWWTGAGLREGDWFFWVEGEPLLHP